MTFVSCIINPLDHSDIDFNCPYIYLKKNLSLSTAERISPPRSTNYPSLGSQHRSGAAENPNPKLTYIKLGQAN